MYRRQRTDAGTGRPRFGRGTGPGRRATSARHLRGADRTSRRADARTDPFPRPITSNPTPIVVHDDGLVCIREETMSCVRSTDLPVETRSRIRRMIQVRDAVRDCLRSQIDGSTEEQVVEARRQLNLAYDRFVARFGPINRPRQSARLRRRPRSAAAAFAGELRRGNQAGGQSRHLPRTHDSPPAAGRIGRHAQGSVARLA